jgi:hypothetical protein
LIVPFTQLPNYIITYLVLHFRGLREAAKVIKSMGDIEESHKRGGKKCQAPGWWWVVVGREKVLE